MNNPRRLWFDFISRERWGAEGVNDAWLITHHSIARGNSDEISPYLVPNEWICGRIASFLGLPVPPFALVKHGVKGKQLFASLKFGGHDALPSDTLPDVLFAKNSKLCSGILLFDILVANADRHAGNLQVDAPHNPREVWMFDHDRALFGCWKNGGRKRLESLRDRLGVSAGSVTGENRHCILDVINTAEHFPAWLDRIYNIPKDFIEDTCLHVVGLGIKKNFATAAVDFIDYRRQNLESIIRENINEFPNISVWPFTL